MTHHTEIEIRIKTNTGHCGTFESSLRITGDDEFELMLQAARATLIAMGFLPSTAERLVLLPAPRMAPTDPEV